MTEEKHLNQLTAPREAERSVFAQEGGGSPIKTPRDSESPPTPAPKPSVSLVTYGGRMAAEAIADALRVSLPGQSVRLSVLRADGGDSLGELRLTPGDPLILWEAASQVFSGLAARPFQYRIMAVCGDPVPSVWLRTAIRSGVRSVVSKSESLETFVAGVQATMVGRCFVSPKMQEYVAGDSSGLRQLDRGGASALTDRQNEILRMLALGFSIRETAKALTLTEKTVESHRYRLCKRLGVHDRSELVAIAIREGLLVA